MIIKPPFKGLMTAVTPELVPPDYATIAENIILTKNGMESDGKYQTAENLKVKIGVGNWSTIRHIHDLEGIFGGDTYLIVLNDLNHIYVNQHLGFLSQAVIDGSISWSASDYHNATYLNYGNYCLILKSDSALVLFDDSGTYRISELIWPTDHDLDPGFYDPSTTHNGAYEGITGRDSRIIHYEYKIVVLSKTGSVMAVDTLIISYNRMSGQTYTAKGFLTNARLLVHKPATIPSFTMEEAVIGQPAVAVKLYRKRAVGHAGINDRMLTGFQETYEEEAEYYLCPNVTVVTNVPSQWRYDDATLDEERNFGEIFIAPDAPIEGANHAITHIDNRVYLAKGDKLQYTYPGELVLQDETLVDQPGQNITGLATNFNNLVVQKRHKTYLMNGFPPSIGFTQLTTVTGGEVPPINIDQMTFMFGRGGIYKLNGVIPQKISHPILDQVSTIVAEGVQLRGARDSDLEVLKLNFDSGTELVWQELGWTTVVRNEEPFNITIDGKKQLTLIETVLGVISLPNLGMSGYAGIFSTWQTPLFTNGFLHKDKHWLNLELAHDTSYLVIYITTYDRDKNIVDSKTFSSISDKYHFRIGTRGRYLQIKFVFTGIITEIKVNANTLTNRS